MAFFYIIKCKNKTYYTGITGRLNRRLKEHELKHGANYTRKYGVDELVYFEKYDNMIDARKREVQVKDWSQLKKENLIYGKWSKDGSRLSSN